MGIRNLFRKSKAEDVRKTYDGKTFILSSYDDINKLMDIRGIAERNSTFMFTNKFLKNFMKLNTI